MGAYQTNTYISSSVQLGAGLSLVEDKNFAANAVNFTGLTGNYIYVAYVAGAAAGAGDMQIKINGNTLNTNYWRQEISGDNLVVTGVRANTNVLGGMAGAGEHVFEITIGGDVYSNYISYQAKQQAISGDIIERVISGNYIAAGAITSIGFTSTAGFSGRAILYKIAQR